MPRETSIRGHGPPEANFSKTHKWMERGLGIAQKCPGHETSEGLSDAGPGSPSLKSVDEDPRSRPLPPKTWGWAGDTLDSHEHGL